MDCPRCNKLLQTEIIKDIKENIEVDTCSTCGGIWFDHRELSKIDKIAEPTFFEIRKIPKTKEQMKILHCPSCNDSIELHKAEHPRDKKVIIDYCPNCKGIWLDKGELEAIQKENWFTTIGRIFNWLMGKD